MSRQRAVRGPAAGSVSAWRVAVRGAAPFGVIVAANALVQALLVAIDPGLPLSAVSLVVAAASGVALLAAVIAAWRVTERAAASVDAAESTPASALAPASAGSTESASALAADVDAALDAQAPARRRPLAGLAVCVLAAGVVTAVAAVVFPPIVPVVIPVGCAVLAAGGVRSAASLVARHPARFVGIALVTLISVVLAWVLDLLLGLFVTGPAAAATSWIVVGAASVVLICHWEALALRPARARL